ncbi:TonB-dependent receptor domain-containing protein, partial [Mariniphaga sediminis]
GSVDYYNAKTSDLLMLRQLPITSGYSSVLENVGSTRNKGIEINLNTIILENPKGINWKMDINWFANKEEILELYDGKKDDVGNNWFIGHPLSVFYDYKKIGIWQSHEEEEATSYGFYPGEIKIKDQEPNGVIDSDDRVIRGSSVPKWNAGITNRFEFKGLDLSCFVFIRHGSTIYSRFHHEFNSLAGRYNNLDVDYWTPDNPTNAYPRPNQNQNYARYDSSNNYFDGSFVKIRNITLGYTLSKKLIEAVKMSNARIYITADNPFMFTKYEGWDPENDKGILYYDVPNSKAIVFGLNVNF